MKVMVAVPCFNEELVLAKTLMRIKESTSHYLDSEIVVIDDGSTDRSKLIAKEIPNISVISHAHNKGLGATFRTAVNHALESNVDVLVTIDADGQFEPDQISHLTSLITSNSYDMVTGSRFLKDSQVSQMPKVKKFGNNLYARLINKIAESSLSDVSCGFRAYSKNALCNLHLTGDFTYTHESIICLSQQGLQLAEIPIKVEYFSDRESVISGSLIRYAINTMRIILKTFISYAPARAFFTLATITSVNSFLLGAVFIYHKLTTGQFGGFYFAAVLSIMFAISSLVFFTAATTSLVVTNILINQRKTLSILLRETYRNSRGS